MSRITKTAVFVFSNVEIELNGKIISMKGKKGELTRIINEAVQIKKDNNTLIFTPCKGFSDGWVQVRTTLALLKAMSIGVSKGFTKKLQLVGIGYRAAIKGNTVNLLLGFSHPINYNLPAGIVAECLSQTEIVLKGIDKQLVGQVAADLRACRRPEIYKGKGIRYIDEVIRTKEAKKK